MRELSPPPEAKKAEDAAEVLRAWIINKGLHCSLSAGAFGGTRGIQDLLPVMRELGLVTIFWDVNFANVHSAFSKDGTLHEQAMLPRIDTFLKELIWMAKTLRHGREHIILD